MIATPSFIAGLITGAAAMPAILLFRRASREGLRRRGQLLLAGGLAAGAIVVVIAATSLTGNSRQVSVASPGASDVADAPAMVASSSPATATAGMPSAAMMSQILANPRAARTQSAEPMDEAAASLAARLERQGGTAADWILLAQAYDFLGRSDDARRARARAAQIGAIQRAP